ncbi:MAG: hypothetical protein ACLTBV_26940 [Enterocloster bolteae]
MSDPRRQACPPWKPSGAPCQSTLPPSLSPIRRTQASSIPQIKEIVDAAHEVEAPSATVTKANVNGIMTAARAKEIWADLMPLQSALKPFPPLTAAWDPALALSVSGSR